MPKINLNISSNFLEELDTVSRKHGMNRSEFIRESVVSFISLKQEEEKKMLKRKKIEEAMLFFDKMSKKNKGWDGIREINKWRETRKV